MLLVDSVDDDVDAGSRDLVHVPEHLSSRLRDGYVMSVLLEKLYLLDDFERLPTEGEVEIRGQRLIDESLQEKRLQHLQTVSVPGNGEIGEFFGKWMRERNALSVDHVERIFLVDFLEESPGLVRVPLRRSTADEVKLRRCPGGVTGGEGFLRRGGEDFDAVTAAGEIRVKGQRVALHAAGNGAYGPFAGENSDFKGFRRRGYLRKPKVVPGELRFSEIAGPGEAALRWRSVHTDAVLQEVENDDGGESKEKKEEKDGSMGD